MNKTSPLNIINRRQIPECEKPQMHAGRTEPFCAGS